jgi:asparagine synthase (glutamine-hydrolysing)
MEKVTAFLAPYGPDSNGSYSKDGINIAYRGFHTTKESRREEQPCVSPSGAVITWDGRLDNRADLIGDLCNSLSVDSTDIAVVSAAYERWGANCLGELIGDWALSIWNPQERSVLLAKDPIGTKHLYYSFDDKHLAWSTILDPLVLFGGRSFAICEEYIASWLAMMHPAGHLTPYVDIHSVPPSYLVMLRPGKQGVRQTVRKYWEFDPAKRIRYRTDVEYEEHFRSVLATAVRRRLRADRPVLAELSGGLDSSSIVCMADLVIAGGKAECPRLDTITWYDESKPNWGEFPHFTRVEERRGRVGHHINAGALTDDHSQMPFGTEFLSNCFASTPIPNSHQSDFFRLNAEYVRSGGYRVTLSGVGGEVTGDGVPTPTPEFQNLLVRAQFLTLSRQLKAWAAKMRAPQLPLLWDALREFFPLTIWGVPGHVSPAAGWLLPRFVRRNHAALRCRSFRVKVFGPLPSFQHNLRALDANRRLFALYTLQKELLSEVRYPYLDRDLLEFMYAIPREQIVGVGQRRFLMKRALVGIVPDEILKRKKKTILQEGSNSATPVRASIAWPNLTDIGQPTVSSCLEIIDPHRFGNALQKALRHEEVPIKSLQCTLTLESWLRHLAAQRILKNAIAANPRAVHRFRRPRTSKLPTRPKSLAS